MSQVNDPSELPRSSLHILFELAKTLAPLDSFEAVLSVVTHQAAEMLRADDANLLMVNPITFQTIKTIVHAREKNPLFAKVRTLVSGWIFKHGEICYVPEGRKAQLFKNTALYQKFAGSVIGAPLRIGGRIIGTLILLREDKPFLEADAQFLEHLALIAAPYLRDVSSLQSYFQADMPEDTLRAKYEKMGLYGKSKKFVELLKSIEAAANTDVRVLLEGESGTGKERIARAVHKLSGRNDKPFIAIDCGAIPANLIESELFGHVRGAFTGANTDRKGLLEEANHGTLFLDEIASMPVDVQSKLLRVLQEGEIKPVGSNKTRSVDVRIIAASSMSLQKLVENNGFREDLYYRLYVYPIHVPSLSARKQDIPRLATFFLRRFAEEQQKRAGFFHHDLLDFLTNRPWNGNIRELENCVERLVTLAKKDAERISPDVLPPDLLKEFKKQKPQALAVDGVLSLTERVTELESDLIRGALLNSDWNQSQAARALRISEYTLRYKMSNLGIKKPEA